jgi:alkylated DNA nucleotide flippase Atl1
VEAVLSAVEQIPPGQVASYGDIADYVGAGGPRLVGRVMATQGAGVPWWRVVRADGSLPPSHHDEARQAYLEEATPLRPSGNVDLRRAFFRPVLAARPAAPAARAPAGRSRPEA